MPTIISKFKKILACLLEGTFFFSSSGDPKMQIFVVILYSYYKNYCKLPIRIQKLKFELILGGLKDFKKCISGNRLVFNSLPILYK